ncbi:MAG: YqhA family protein [Candidatus Pacebacteria bacterium]|nr:YqhA family protein [Candidatus Paceibacterota bacterium]MBP9866595.1 YqhA family protein [Candidatus Paceibacterota bacterium]
MNKDFLSFIGEKLFGLRVIMSFFFVGLIVVIFAILWKFCLEIGHLVYALFDKELEKTVLIIKVLELVDMTMVAQLVWVVALAGFSLFVTSEHFDKNKEISKPDWLDHVNTYNLKLKLAFAMIAISGVHALKTYLQGGVPYVEMIVVVCIHFLFVLSAVGISFAEYLTRKGDTSK